MGKYILLENASSDLFNIYSYSRENFGLNQARKYTNLVYSRFSWLADSPKLGKKRDDIKNGYYSYNEGMHTIFYRIAQDYIEIIGVLHQNMDIKEHL